MSKPTTSSQSGSLKPAYSFALVGGLVVLLAAIMAAALYFVRRGRNCSLSITRPVSSEKSQQRRKTPEYLQSLPVFEYRHLPEMQNVFQDSSFHSSQDSKTNARQAVDLERGYMESSVGEEDPTEPRASFNECSICTHDFTMSCKVRQLPCRHIYHSDCIDPWLSRGKCTCPNW